MPSKISFWVELNILLSAWKTGTPQFYKMTHDEFKGVEALTDNVDSSSILLVPVKDPSISTSAISLSTDASRVLVTIMGSNINANDVTLKLLCRIIINTIFRGDDAVDFVTKKP